MSDKPEDGKQYRLTGKTGTKCIANGDTWAESEVEKPFKVQVIADNSGRWVGNQCRYATKVEAETAARDLARRWLLVRRWQVVETGEFPGLEKTVSESHP